MLSLPKTPNQPPSKQYTGCLTLQLCCTVLQIAIVPLDLTEAILPRLEYDLWSADEGMAGSGSMTLPLVFLYDLLLAVLLGRETSTGVRVAAESGRRVEASEAAEDGRSSLVLLAALTGRELPGLEADSLSFD